MRAAFSAAVMGLAVLLASCSPNPASEFDASCANDLECMGWYVTDYCDDGLDITYSFFGPGFPRPEWGPFTTPELGKYVTGTLKCQPGAQVCLGASAGERIWGLGPEGDGSCAACCGVCDGISYEFPLSCQSSKQGQRAVGGGLSAEEKGGHHVP